MRIADEVRTALEDALGVAVTLEVPPDASLGDFAVPCFPFAKELRKAPAAIAEDFAARIPTEGFIARAEAAGPYLNVFLDRSVAAERITDAAVSFAPREEKLLFEYLSPNTNKPLHLGHLRNLLLGTSLAAIAQEAGYKVLRTNIYNDRGIHICKSMLAYQKWGDGATPEDMSMKPDHFVGHWYVEFAKRADAALEAEAQEMLRAWEAGDPAVRALWQRMNEWVYKGYQETFDRLDVPAFDFILHESDIYTRGAQLVEEGLSAGVFARDEDGNVRADLGKLGDPVVLRADGTTVYMTQDLYLAQLRQKEYAPDSQVYVVGEEQKHRFQQLFAILERLGMEHADRLFHLAYGYISLPEGRMKSREGTVVDTDNLLAEMEALAADAVRERHPDLSADEVSRRACIIGDGALRFFILKYEPKTAFTYDPKESLSFEGETGPYVQYAVARINSMLRERAPPADADVSLLTSDAEWSLLSALMRTPEVIEEAAESYKPHLVARHAMAVAQAFTAFYHACPVLKADDALRDARLRLCASVKEHLELLLGLLGIETLDEM